jgi:hypothetical protein
MHAREALIFLKAISLRMGDAFKNPFDLVIPARRTFRASRLKCEESVMRAERNCKRGAASVGWWAATAALAALAIAQIPSAQAQDAARIFKAMSDYVANQSVLSLAFDSDIEVVTSDLQKIQFTSSGQVLLNRPDKIRASRTGGYADIELVFDGQTVTALGKSVNLFAQANAPGSVDQLIDRLRDQYGVAMPGADLLLSRVYDELMAGVLDAKHIGLGVVDGVDCEHLAFRNADVDWQLWVEVGPRPIPRKYVITSKAVTGAPQYTLRIKEWRTDVPPAAEAFAFKPPADAKLVGFAALREIDEIPPGQSSGGSK